MNRKAICITLLLVSLMIAAHVCSINTSAVSAETSGFIPETNQDLLPTVLDGCRSAVSAIKSGQGKVTAYASLRSNNGGILETETTYQVLFSGDKFKLAVDEKYLKNSPGEPLPSDRMLLEPGSLISRQVAYDAERTTTFMPQEHEATIGDRSTNSGQEAIDDGHNAAFVGHYGLLEIAKWVVGPSVYTRGTPKIVGRETLNGNDCVVVEFLLTGKDIVHTFWFWVDPAKGFTVPRIRSWAEGTGLREKILTGEVNTEMRQYADGNWGPARATVAQYRINPLSGEYYRNAQYVTTFDPNFQINVPVTDSELTLTLPSGTTVTNELLQETYTVP